MSYNNIYDEFCLENFGVPYDSITAEQKKVIRKEYPRNISLSEPE